MNKHLKSGQDGETGEWFVSWAGDPTGRRFNFVNGDVESEREATAAASDYADAIIAQRTKLAQRPLTEKEATFGIELKDTRTESQRVADANFTLHKPVILTEAERVLEQLTAEAAKDKERREKSELSESERRVYDQRKIVESEREAAEQKEILRKHLESPVVVKLTAALQELREQRRFSDSSTVGDVVEVDNALAALRNPEWAVPALDHVRGVFKRDDAKKQAAVEAKKQWINAQAATLATARAELDSSRSATRSEAERLLTGKPGADE